MGCAEGELRSCTAEWYSGAQGGKTTFRQIINDPGNENKSLLIFKACAKIYGMTPVMCVCAHACVCVHRGVCMADGRNQRGQAVAGTLGFDSNLI